jgi:hypothetical protein
LVSPRAPVIGGLEAVAGSGDRKEAKRKRDDTASPSGPDLSARTDAKKAR